MKRKRDIAEEWISELEGYARNATRGQQEKPRNMENTRVLKRENKTKEIKENF